MTVEREKNIDEYIVPFEVDKEGNLNVDIELERSCYKDYYKRCSVKDRYFNFNTPNKLLDKKIENSYIMPMVEYDKYYFNTLGYIWDNINISNNRYLNTQINYPKLGDIGIDRFKLYVELEKIDSRKFTNIKRYEFGENPKEIIDISTGEYVQFVDLDDEETIKNYFKESKSLKAYELRLSKRYLYSSKRVICELDITAPVALNNTFNIFNVSPNSIEYLLHKIKLELEEKGLYISFEHSYLFYLEINKTVLADKPLYKYENVLRFLGSKIFNGKVYPDNQTEKVKSMTLTINNSKEIINLYDKSAELINVYNYDPKNHLYRLEIKLGSEDNIRRFLGGSKLYDLNKDTDSLFINTIQKKLIDKISKYIKNQIDDLYKAITSIDLECLQSVYLSNEDKLLDIELLGIALYQANKRLGNGKNLSRKFNSLLDNNPFIMKKIDQIKQLEYILSLVCCDQIQLNINDNKHVSKHIANYKNKH